MRTSCRERLEVTEARSDHLPWMSSARETGAVGFDQEAADLVVFVLDLGPDDGDVGDGAGGDPHFFAVEDVFVAVFAGAGAHAAGVGAEVGFGEAEAAELFALLHAREARSVFARRCRRSWMGYMHSAGLHADEAAHAGVAALEFLGDQAVFDVATCRRSRSR